MNVFTFTGNIGRDAEQRFTQKGDSIVSFSVAVKAGFGQQEKTTWVKCNLWGKRGDSVMPYLTKGALVGVNGEFSMSEWTDKEGAVKCSPEVRVNDVSLLGGKKEGNSASVPVQNTQNSSSSRNSGAALPTDFEDNIPF